MPQSDSFISERDGKAVILVVDDEPVVRAFMQMTLTRAGYHVLTASDGVEALQLSGTYRGAIDVVVSDVKMPNMMGPELAATILRERPGIRVLLMSGKATAGIPPQLLTGMLRKPFLPRQLLERIQQVLAEG